MNEKFLSSNNKDIKFCENILIYVFLNFFFSLLIIKLGLIFSLSFKYVSYLTLFALICVNFIYFKKNKDFLNIQGNVSTLTGSIFTGLTAIFINRYSGDDGSYLSKAVFYSENPQSILDYSVTWIANIPSDAKVFIHFNYETLSAILAWLLKLKLLTVSHLFFPFIIGFIFFISIYLVTSFLEEDKLNKFYVSILFIFLLLILGETSRNFGTYSFGRMHQGKSIVLFLGFFTWTYFSLNFFIKRNLRNFLILLFVGFTLSEISTTGIIFIPILSSVLFLSYQFYSKNLLSYNFLKYGFAYLVVLIPVLLNGLMLKAQISTKVQQNLESKFSSNYWDQLSFFIGEIPLTIYLFFISLVFLLFFNKNRINKFFLFWIFISFILYLNPITSPFIMKYVTTNSIYWRLFYILPFPFILILIFLKLFNWFEKKNRNSFFFILVCFFLLLIKFSPTSIINQPAGAKIKIPSYKMTPVAKLVVKRFSENFPTGTMVSDPKRYSVPFTIYNSNYKQFFLEPFILKNLSNNKSWQEEVLIREKSMKFLYRDKISKSYADSFELFLKKNCPDYILQDVDTRKYNVELVKKILIEFGYFIENNNFPKYKLHPDIIVWKSPCRNWKKDFLK